MESVMIQAYPNVAIEAIHRGFDGSLERCMAEVIKRDYLSNHSEAREIVDSLRPTGESYTLKQAYLKAAYLITSSKTENHFNTLDHEQTK
jgi:hypothetical protein